MRLPVTKILSVATIIGALLIGSILFISLKQSHKISDTERSMSHTGQVLSHIQNMELYVLDNEAWARGYVITANEQYLSSLESSEYKINQELASLQSMGLDQVAQGLLNDSLRFYIRKRIEHSRLKVSVRKKEGFDAASKIVLSGEGIYYINKIHQFSLALQNYEKASLEKKQERNDRLNKQLSTVLYTILSVGFIALVILIVKIRSDINKQELNEHKFSALLDAAPDATVIVNEKGIIQMINQQVENVFGYTKKEIIGQPVELLIPQELHAEHAKHRKGFVKEAKARSMGQGIELKAVRKGGISFPVEISLSPIKTKEGLLISASVRDITDRKKLEEKFRSLLDSAPDATVIVDENGVIQMINHQTENLFGYTRIELIGQRVEKLIPPELKDKHVQHRGNFFKAAKVRSMGAGIELNALKKNGTRFPVEISLSPIQTEEGMLVSASVRDITFRKTLENELRKSNEEMEAFTYSVSHDLRAPLRGIIGFTAILEEEYASQLDDEARRITGVIKANTLKMGHLIDDLLGFSRAGKQEILKTMVNTKQLVNEVIDELVQAGTSVPVTWNIGHLPPVEGDTNTMRQVWINLISNAIKYTGNNKQAIIEIGSTFDEGSVVFYVKDNGVGFDEQYKHKLFKVFQRLHDQEEFEGTGVGLALVEKIISKHGGKVWAEGKQNDGACFYFSLPL